MSLLNTVETVRTFLRTNGDRAHLVSEVVMAARSQPGLESEVLGAIEDLAAAGEVFSRSFSVRDPHLAFTSLQFVTAVGPAEDSRQAELRTERAYQAWLREWVSSHRCG